MTHSRPMQPEVGSANLDATRPIALSSTKVTPKSSSDDLPVHVPPNEKANWSLCCGPGNFCYRFDSTSPARPNCAVATTLHHLFSGCFSRCLLPGVGSGCVSAGLVHHRRHDVGRSIRA